LCVVGSGKGAADDLDEPACAEVFETGKFDLVGGFVYKMFESPERGETNA